MAAGLTNDRPPGRETLANAPPSGLTRRANAPQLPGGGMGTPGIDWCIKRYTSYLETPSRERFTEYHVYRSDFEFGFPGR